MPKTLLLADDSVTIQRVIELTFADENIEVVAVGDGHAAIERLDGDPPPDIVLADVGMPGATGYDVALHVRRTPALAHIPVVLLAGALEPIDEARARQAGCAGVLVKPFEPQLVIARVRELLAGDGQGPALPAHEAPSAGDALIASPGSGPTQGPSVDDYFDRLDAAFASLDAATPDAIPQTAGASPSASPPPPPPSARPDAEAAPWGSSGPGMRSMADAFGAVLGVEQGQPPPLLPDAWTPGGTDALVEQVARRVTEQVSERIVREIAPDVVSRVAERLVAEEIARLKALSAQR